MALVVTICGGVRARTKCTGAVFSPSPLCVKAAAAIIGAEMRAALVSVDIAHMHIVGVVAVVAVGDVEVHKASASGDMSAKRSFSALLLLLMWYRRRRPLSPSYSFRRNGRTGTVGDVGAVCAFSFNFIC